MRIGANRNQASIKFGPLIVLVALALGVAFYFWKDAPVERQLSAEIVAFEVKTERNENRNPPLRESLVATVRFANGGKRAETILKARFLVSSKADLSSPRSWSPTLHRDSMVRELKLSPGETLTHTFVIPWTGREEARYFADGTQVHLGFSISAKERDGEPVTLTRRFGHVIPLESRIESSDHQLVVLEFPKE
jgi:hypothetical protein